MRGDRSGSGLTPKSALRFRRRPQPGVTVLTPNLGRRNADWFSRPLAVSPTLPHIVIGSFKDERE